MLNQDRDMYKVRRLRVRAILGTCMPACICLLTSVFSEAARAMWQLPATCCFLVSHRMPRLLYMYSWCCMCINTTCPITCLCLVQLSFQFHSCFDLDVRSYNVAIIFWKQQQVVSHPIQLEPYMCTLVFNGCVVNNDSATISTLDAWGSRLASYNMHQHVA